MPTITGNNSQVEGGRNHQLFKQICAEIPPDGEIQGTQPPSGNWHPNEAKQLKGSNQITAPLAPVSPPKQLKGSNRIAAPLAPLAPLAPSKLISLSMVATEDLQWLFPNLIPLGSITTLDGSKAEGKSTLLYDLTARVTSGTPMPFSGNHTVTGGVIMLEAEDDLGTTIKKGIVAAGGVLDRIRVFSKREALHLDAPEDLGLIQKTAGEIGAKLLVVNPFSEFFSKTLKDEKTIREAFRPLRALAASLGMAVVLVRHFTKSGSSALTRGLGGVAIINAARSSLVVSHDSSSDDKYQHVLAFNRGNLPRTRDVSLVYRTVKRDDAIVVEWLGESRQTADELIASSSDSHDASQLEEAKYVLYSILFTNGGQLPATQAVKAAQQAAVSIGTLKRARKKLKVPSRQKRFITSVRGEDGEVELQSKMCWVWTLPADEDLLRPYRERFEREEAENEAEHGEESSLSSDLQTVG
jgi:archaellum biogenesis ATPase FlaH